ncbi:ribonuclease K3 [Pipistrellus kuhlii]|uniref:Ribonuclease A family member k6 n=1 Tax=Pipistrellus kuhlii TaxID=59472 RepID=A0A7J8B519_PIPKU|nr:ribonuclease K3 [Pipistrellus kuhlii]KAF6393546.1 ribonuclease A family member k6 [Pipistrellus kuhlii]
MVLDLLRRFTPLLLLLGLWGPVYQSYALPKKFTKAKWFEIEHIQPNPLQCNKAMSNVNKYTKTCKPLNTFLHDSLEKVTATCKEKKTKCKNGQHNCHQSANPVSLTNCSLAGGKYPNCSYKDFPQTKFYIIACDPPKKTDPQYPLVPVHLDKVL